MVNEYTLYVWESQRNGSSFFCYDLLNNQTNEIEMGGGCVDPYMLSEEIKKSRLFNGRERDVSVQYKGEPSPETSFSFEVDLDLSQGIRSYLERTLEINFRHYIN